MIDLNTHKREIFNPLIYDLQDAHKRFVINYGGAGSGKSYTQTQHEIMNCLESKHVMLVIRKFGTTLKDSVIALFKSILSDWDLNGLYLENKSDRTITFENGSVILFKGMDDPEKIKSVAGVTRVWIEEASELTMDDFKQLNLRLRGKQGLQMTLTLNPIDENHWIKKHFIDTDEIRNKSNIIKTTYKDNVFIDDDYKAELESYKLFDKNYYNVYALGEWGCITEGRIFAEWSKIDALPNFDTWFGLDFGFSNDPTAIVEVCSKGNDIFLKEWCYQKEMTNSEIANFLKSQGYSGQVVICDSAEVKSIVELKQCGINAVPADKRPGSIMAGIDYLKSHNVSFTIDSNNIRKENLYYQWMRDRDGNYINKPKDFMNHIIDAIRYAFSIYVYPSSENPFFYAQ